MSFEEWYKSSVVKIYYTHELKEICKMAFEAGQEEERLYIADQIDQIAQTTHDERTYELYEPLALDIATGDL